MEHFPVFYVLTFNIIADFGDSVLNILSEHLHLFKPEFTLFIMLL